MSKLRVGDSVVVIAGNDKGKQGKILRMNSERVVVEGINIRKKHMRKKQENQKSQIIDIECPVHISNVKLMVGDKAVRLKVKTNPKGEKELCYRNGKSLEVYRLASQPAKS